ncbi:rho family-interacting cell polarization regulator 2-like isoform X2 [Artemia franciscana]|uniref:rho family-interacting cell polarization regulator 2-like isoform X2 n=1 Tax=Artemia franciscana TaxID=6661 RepID=UPI0032DAFFD1
MSVRNSSNFRNSWYGRPLTSVSNMGSVRSITSQMSTTTMASRSSTLTRPPPGTKLKIPRPQQCTALFEAMLGALRECISITESDIANLKLSLDNVHNLSGTSQGKAYDLDKQLRSAERYLRRLEYQITSMDELYESYHVQGRLRDGVRTIARAYADSPGKEKESTVVNVHQGFHECSSAMSSIESQLESHLGSFRIELKGLQGFARLCPGDVFEISLRHGPQKWKSKGRIAKDSSQTWDSTEATLKPIFDQVLIIRAVELRSFGKKVALGDKFCQVLDLFCAVPQLMTVNLNSSGSLKLHLMITWDPLDGCDEGVAAKHQVNSPNLSRKVSILSKGYQPSTSVSRTPSMVQRSISSTSKVSSSSSLKEEDEENQESSLVQRNADVDLDIINKVTSRINHSSDLNSSGNFTLIKKAEKEDKWWSPTHTMDSGYSGSLSGKKGKQLFTSVFLVPEEGQPDSLVSDAGESLVSDTTESTLGGLIRHVLSSVDDIRGRYPELELFEKNIAVLSHLVKHDSSRPDSRTSNASSAVVSALEAFDFLNLEDEDENKGDRGSLSPVERQLKNRTNHLSRSNSGTNSESCSRSSSATRDTSLSPSLSSTSQCSTGNEQLDLALKVHLEYSKELCERLGVYGPLNSRESEALHHLHQQGKILSKILKNVKCGTTSVTGMSELESHKSLQSLWERVTPEGNDLVVTGNAIVSSLLSICKTLLESKSELFCERVLKELVCRCQESESFSPESLVTVYQFRQYIRSKERSFVTRLEELSDEIFILDSLSNAESTIQLQKLLNRLSLPIVFPTPKIILAIGTIASSSENPESKKLAKDFLDSRSSVPQHGELYKNVFTRALESHNSSSRIVACSVLGYMHAFTALAHLEFIVQTDRDENVRTTAQRAIDYISHSETSNAEK